MNVHRQWLPIRAVVLISLVAAGGCTKEQELSTSLLTNDSQFVFLAQSARPDAVMDALFEGDVSVDAAGCLRLALSESPTVVWPHGYTSELRDGRVIVRDETGRERGRVDGRFRLGGGIVPELHDGVPLSASDRAAAAGRCPGRFWIVGEVL